MFYFTDFTFLRGDQIDAATAHRIAKALKADGRPLYSVLFQFESNMTDKIPGRWGMISIDDDVFVQRCDVAGAAPDPRGAAAPPAQEFRR